VWLVRKCFKFCRRLVVGHSDSRYGAVHLDLLFYEIQICRTVWPPAGRRAAR